MPTPPVQAKGPVRTDMTEAAELVQAAARLLEDFEDHRDMSVVAGTAVARAKLTNALRLLERRGAETRPDPL